MIVDKDDIFKEFKLLIEFIKEKYQKLNLTTP